MLRLLHIAVRSCSRHDMVAAWLSQVALFVFVRACVRVYGKGVEKRYWEVHLQLQLLQMFLKRKPKLSVVLEQCFPFAGFTNVSEAMRIPSCSQF